MREVIHICNTQLERHDIYDERDVEYIMRETMQNAIYN